ncbi:PQQ-dependent sugar dehydrogenase [uncultured Phycicoccus sp.]|uniref:PQQ-dependent sugar dehydrogenase n=1 Tax=uncultured Phycicoccus sp. TaxID=661422 RepID=UPI00262DA0AF|nr:PQQ-dependent sugar dehydrogenase [uncultured Phycicoccus sp.]
MLGSRIARPALAVVSALAVAATLSSPPAAGAPTSATAAPVAAAPAPTEAIVADSLVVPWDLAFLPDGRMVATERPGRIRVYADGGPDAALQRTVTVPDVELGTGEAGVMGVAVDTDFGAFPYLYVCASREYPGSGGWVNQVLRYSVAGSTAWSTPTVLLGGMKAGRTHNGCALEMDDAGHLWVAMGDGGTEALAQDRSSRNGKVLRLTRTGGVPADNPVIDGVQDHVYSMGHRNPQGLAFQPGTDRVYAVEHGPSVDDEINLLVPGGNYGWPCETGAGLSYRPETAGCDDGDTYLAPAWASGTSTIATSGATFLRGAQWGDLEGDLVVPTLKQQDLRVFDVDADGVLTAGETRYDGTYGRLRGAVSGPGGRLYLTTSNGSDKVVRVSPATSELTRVQGADRYAVAANVSRATYPDGASDVVVATGAVYPDALAGSAAGGRLGMPVLLSRPDALPDSTRAELERLGAQRVWVLGGAASVSEPVRAELAEYAAEGSATRIGGPDRYAVAAGVSGEFYSRGVPAVFLASGEVFADALSAAPAAARTEAPLLLVTSSRVPGSTGEELKRLAPERIYVLGGTGTIPQSVVTSLRHYSSAPVTRLGGRTRYDVARTVAEEFWTTADVFVASGEKFPDGLTGGAAAGHRGAALLLARAGSVPVETGQQMLTLAPTATTLVGGTASLGEGTSETLGRLAGTR